jgi:hypothetical protein
MAPAKSSVVGYQLSVTDRRPSEYFAAKQRQLAFSFLEVRFLSVPHELSLDREDRL